ncbi:YcaO-like family protein [Sphingomicrobium nitratireducens]|uniref:YcaO-like family protein n=1 Tax=Sphingomicrobium nitratireducens TaxID=2964666 RepID=UPI002240B167|nr:YcaO-like family protein [Sphingomicrobium nitratireducens]
MIGPPDTSRAAPPDTLLAAARRAAVEAGVTRLADVTRLDCIGLPVWQAVRPMSRALSVHQGKGATHAAAQIGALLEGVESDAAERFEGEGPTAAWNDLDPVTRPADLTGLARDPDAPPSPDRPYRWAKAERLGSGEAFLPFDTVSLDFTRGFPTDFERASAGVATGTTRDEAIRVGLSELVERDARAAFTRADDFFRLEQEITLSSIAFDWFGALRERLEQAGASLRVFHFPSLTGTPVIACTLADQGKGVLAYASLLGHAAHADPEQALFQALAEALQGRATYIAGARDDLLPEHYEKAVRAGFLLAPPPASNVDGKPFGAIPPGPDDWQALSDRLAQRGFADQFVVPLRDAHGFTTVRVTVPGLGTLRKGRRP